jgi:hypothetical protein
MAVHISQRIPETCCESAHATIARSLRTCWNNGTRLEKEEDTMLHKLTRVDLIEAHGVMCEKIMDNDIALFGETSPAETGYEFRARMQSELEERAKKLDGILAAASDYAMIVVDDTFAHLGFHSIYARNYVGAIREASEALNKLLIAHAAKLGDRGQPDDAA